MPTPYNPNRSQPRERPARSKRETSMPRMAKMPRMRKALPSGSATRGRMNSARRGH